MMKCADKMWNVLIHMFVYKGKIGSALRRDEYFLSRPLPETVQKWKMMRYNV